MRCRERTPRSIGNGNRISLVFDGNGYYYDVIQPRSRRPDRAGRRTAGRVMSMYLSRLKRHVCDKFENPPLLQAVPTAAAAVVRLRTACAAVAGTGASARDAAAAAIAVAARDAPHDTQNLAANFRPPAFRAARGPTSRPAGSSSSRPSRRRCCCSRARPPW